MKRARLKVRYTFAGVYKQSGRRVEKKFTNEREALAAHRKMRESASYRNVSPVRREVGY